MTNVESMLMVAAVNVYLIVYAALCAIISWRAFDALRCMSRRTCHVRRIAFVLLCVAGVIGLLEVWERALPLASMLLFSAGALLIALVGLRKSAREE